ncbi:MAG: hypothetical protein PHF84_07960 [bacterium]|nr:hypothetical protein [bacterium]
MKFKYCALLLILTLLSCFKSQEQQMLDREKAQEMMKEADLLFSRSKYNEALDLYLKTSKLDYEEPLLIYKIAFCYDKGPKDYQKAAKYYEKALKSLNVQNNLKYMAAAYFNLGVIAGKMDEQDQKLSYFSTAFSLLQKMETIGRLDAEDYFRIGYIYWDKKEYTPAQKYFLTSIRLFKKTNPTHFYHAGAYYNIGLIYWVKEDYNTTLWYWKRALKLEPDNEFYKEWIKKAAKFRNASST